LCPPFGEHWFITCQRLEGFIRYNVLVSIVTVIYRATSELRIQKRRVIEAGDSWVLCSHLRNEQTLTTPADAFLLARSDLYFKNVWHWIRSGKTQQALPMNIRI
jgi:hypothetical protein